ncbi:MAG: Wzt carbohydrate-binding domain-containing protein, partial [Gammaproteobacteria bacterium]
ILVVSHSGSAIVELCDRAILMDTGEKLAVGPPKQIVGRYQKLIYAPADKQEELRSQIRRADTDVIPSLNNLENTPREHPAPVAHPPELQASFDPQLKPSSTIEYESHGTFIESPVILTLAGEQVNNLVRGETYRYGYNVRFIRRADKVRFGMLIKTTSGVELGGGATASSPRDSLACVEAGSIYRIEFRFRCVLNSGVYFLNAGVMGEIEGSETYLHRLIDVAMFRVLADADSLSSGTVDFGCEPEIDLQHA